MWLDDPMGGPYYSPPRQKKQKKFYVVGRDRGQSRFQRSCCSPLGVYYPSREAAVEALNSTTITLMTHEKGTQYAIVELVEPEVVKEVTFTERKVWR